MTPVTIELDDDVHCQLGEIASSLPPFRFTADGHLEPPILAQIRASASKLSRLTEVTQHARWLLESYPDSPGYLVARNMLPPGMDEEAGLVRAACFNALLGSPFHMVSRVRLWEQLIVSFDAEPFRSGGIGHNPLHIDGVNTEHPPDFLTLLCIRPDPGGGGVTLLANLQAMVSRLSASETAELQQARFCEGKFFDLVGVGAELNPFPALQRLPNGRWRIRVTGKMLHGAPATLSTELMARLIEMLKQDQMRIPLKAGEAVYLNQLVWAHGREALSAEQESIRPDRRRYVQQSFIKRRDAA